MLAIFVGVVLIENKSQDLYGGLLGWPFHDTGPLRLILVLFFLVEGGVSIMFGMEHRRHFSTRWAFIFASGVVDIVLASIIIFALPGTSAWTLGLLVGINMVCGVGPVRNRNARAYGVGRCQRNFTAKPWLGFADPAKDYHCVDCSALESAGLKPAARARP